MYHSQRWRENLQVDRGKRHILLRPPHLPCFLGFVASRSPGWEPWPLSTRGLEAKLTWVSVLFLAPVLPVAAPRTKSTSRCGHSLRLHCVDADFREIKLGIHSHGLWRPFFRHNWLWVEIWKTNTPVVGLSATSASFWSAYILFCLRPLHLLFLGLRFSYRPLQR